MRGVMVHTGLSKSRVEGIQKRAGRNSIRPSTPCRFDSCPPLQCTNTRENITLSDAMRAGTSHGTGLPK